METGLLLALKMEPVRDIQLMVINLNIIVFGKMQKDGFPISNLMPRILN